MDIENIIKTMPQNLNNMEKARYIYLQLCKQISYDPKYLIADTLEEKQKMFDEDVKIEEWDKSEMICSTMSKLYVQLLNKIGINAKEVHLQEGQYCGHMFVVFEDNGKNYYADPIHDLLYVKKGFQTRCFASMPYEEQEDIEKNGSKYEKYNFATISKEELKKIDDKLGYTYKGLYMEDVIEELKEEMQIPRIKEGEKETEFNKRMSKYNDGIKELGQIFNKEELNENELIEYKINFIRNFIDAKGLTAMEKTDYFATMIRACMNPEDKEKYEYYTLKCTEDGQSIRILADLKEKETGKRNIYTFSDEDFVLQVDEEYVRKKVQNGMRPLSKDKEKMKLLEELTQNEDSRKSKTEMKNVAESSETMERIKLEDLDYENTYFHFTKSENLYDNEDGIGIINGGLTSIPRKRPHIVGSDKKNPAIYFAIGVKGVLELIDVWVRYEYNEIATKNGKPDGHISVDEKIMLNTYKKVYEEFKQRKYLKLDLIPGKDPKTSDFDPEGIDIKKQEYFGGEAINEFAKWVYGPNTNYESNVMDRWNMNTHIGKKTILPARIKMIQNSKGRTDALSVIAEIYEKFRTEDMILPDLDNFMKYVQERYKEDENNRTQNLGRETLEAQKNITSIIDEENIIMDQEQKMRIGQEK